MEFLVGVFVIGLLWLLAVILVPIAAVLIAAPRPKKPKAKKPRPRPAPRPKPAPPAPSPGYIRRWSNARRAWEINELQRFQQLLDR